MLLHSRLGHGLSANRSPCTIRCRCWTTAGMQTGISVLPTWHQTGKVGKQVLLCLRTAVLGPGRLVMGCVRQLHGSSGALQVGKQVYLLTSAEKLWECKESSPCLHSMRLGHSN